MITPAGNGSPGRYHHGDLRRALVRSGRDLLREGGVDALTLRAAAARAGVSVAAPYRHFTDKQALLTAVLADGLRDLQQALVIAETVDPVARLHALGHKFVDLALAEPELFRLLASSGPRGDDPELAEAEREAFGSFTAAIEQAIAVGAIEADSPETVQVTMQCVILGLAGLITQGAVPAPVAHELADRVMKTVDRGLLPRHE
ncbi:TetR/AcrR family transcriptional regulator [Kribbella sp. CA-294648]|uniref:TetR/AcrR family transcriptional regulator n=1 Tax=Kribbella sp. CA-294648 TaxID=3239948 RepID=UPI003D8B0278